MSRETIRSMHKHNLASVYILPLLEISMFNFGVDNFVNTYIHPDGTMLYVEVKAYDDTEDPYHNEYYHSTITTEDKRKFIVFTIPGMWTHTFQKFKEGKYSEFTKLAKATIIQHSGLSWKVRTDQGTEISDARLLAMYKRESLRLLLAEQLDIHPDDLEGSELLDPPKQSEFMEL